MGGAVVTPAERTQHYAALPGWRKPYGSVNRDDAAERQQRSLCDAIVDLLHDAQLTRDELAARVTEEWGDCTHEQISAALRVLVVDQVVQRAGGRYQLRGGR